MYFEWGGCDATRWLAVVRGNSLIILPDARLFTPELYMRHVN